MGEDTFSQCGVGVRRRRDTTPCDIEGDINVRKVSIPKTFLQLPDNQHINISRLTVRQEYARDRIRQVFLRLLHPQIGQLQLLGIVEKGLFVRG